MLKSRFTETAAFVLVALIAFLIATDRGVHAPSRVAPFPEPAPISSESELAPSFWGFP